MSLPKNSFEIAMKGWVAENAPGGWVDNLRKERDAHRVQVEAQNTEISRLKLERDEYQQAADTQAADHKVERDAALYLKEQMQAYGQQCRSAALEEAAQICDERSNGENDAQYCADRIRSLKS